MTPPFPALLTQHARAAGLSLTAFAERVASSESRVRQVAAGMRPPQMERVEGWADVLGLEGAKREEFLHAAAVASSPRLVREMVRALEQRVAELEAQVQRAAVG